MTFDTFLTAGLQAKAERRRTPFGLSLALHGGALALAILYSVWRVEEVTAPPQVPTLITFARPPGGPPPAAPRAARRNPPRVRPRPAALVQPTPQPVAPIEEPSAVTEGPASDTEAGPPGGGGGGAGEGAGDGDGPPTRFVPPNVARGQLAIDPQADPYRVKLPPVLARARMSLWALVRICVDRDGRVASVQIVKGADPALDPSIVAVLSTWRYRPYTLDGRPIPFCTNVRYEINVP
jgi:TonB family protein